MTDERLSRRARRAQEEDALSGELPTTGITDQASPDTQSLSRRDRRRLERVAHPVEVWTAEEEMIATGQIPKVTPDVIAEQERLAREKAAQAQAEAEAASAELRRVSLAQASPERVAEVTGTMPAQAPAQQQPSLAAPPPAAAPEPSPPSLQMMFPPGSLQARAFEESQARAAQEQAASREAGVGSDAPAPADDGAEEIRRLAAAAMATIESAAPVPTPSAITQIDGGGSTDTPDTAGSHVAPDRYAMPALAEPEAEPDRPRSATASWNAQAPGAAPAPGNASSPSADGLRATPAGGDAPSAPTSGATPTLTPGTGATPTLPPGTGATPTFTPGTGATPTFTPGTGATPAVGAAAWQAHPLDAAPVPGAPVDVNAYAPTANVPQPDFSAVINPANPGNFSPLGPTPASGATPLVTGPATGATPLVPPGAAAPTTTGSIPTVRRAPDLQPAGGARHFRWAHYLVLFALMFIVGVVVFQVFRLNS